MDKSHKWLVANMVACWQHRHRTFVTIAQGSITIVWELWLLSWGVGEHGPFRDSWIPSETPGGFEIFWFLARSPTLCTQSCHVLRSLKHSSENPAPDFFVLFTNNDLLFYFVSATWSLPTAGLCWEHLPSPLKSQMSNALITNSFLLTLSLNSNALVLLTHQDSNPRVSKLFPTRHPPPLFLPSLSCSLGQLGPTLEPLSCEDLHSPCLLTSSQFSLPRAHPQWTQLSAISPATLELLGSISEEARNSLAFYRNTLMASKIDEVFCIAAALLCFPWQILLPFST